MHNQGLGSWIARRASMHSGLALVSSGRSYTYAELHARITRLAHGLDALGVRRGDRVAYLGCNSIAVIETLFAAGAIGAVFVPLNHRASLDTVRYAIADAGVKVLIYHADVAEAVRALGQLGLAGAYVEYGTGTPRIQGAQSYDALLSSQPGEPMDVPVTLDDLCLIGYTSGTTGPPKGVMLTHGNLTWNVLNALSCIDFRGDDVLLAVAPMYRLGGFTAALLPVIYKGGAVVMLDAFAADQTLAAIEEHGVTVMYGGPPYYQAMLDAERFARTDLSTVRFLLCAGAPVPVPLIESYLAHGIEFLQHYGLSEAATRVLMLDRAGMLRKVGSAGRPQFFTEVRAVRPDMSEVAVGESGEIVVRGPNVTRGYWRRPELTAGAITHGGWLHTGDAARVDEDGYFYLLGRLADAMILAGERVFPSEIENALKTHPAILDCAVVGMPDGEGAAAFVVARPGLALGEADVAAFAGQELPSAWQPRVVRLIERIPRNASDKVLRWQLSAMLDDGVGQARR